MAASDASSIEEIVARLLIPVCAASGAVILAGFFFPTFVGSAVTGSAWLALSLVFFSSGLGYIALLPYSSDDQETPAAEVLLRVRRTKLRNAVREFASRNEPVTLVLPVVSFALFFGLQLALPEQTTAVVSGVSTAILRGGGPLFLAAMLLAVCYCFFLLLGPWGDIKLGGPEMEPSYTYPTYFTLIFTAGIAAGLVFWGPAEALFHYESPPPYFGATAESSGAIGSGLVYSLFHWGISAWSAYVALAIPIAYYVYNKGAPLRVSALLMPFLGRDNLADHPLSKLVDVLAVFATIGGVGISVGFVGGQFLSGVEFQWGTETSTVDTTIVIAGITVIFTVSVITGVKRGIRRIAGINVIVFGAVAVLTVVLGPTQYILTNTVWAFVDYALNFVQMNIAAMTPGGDQGWFNAWTLFYWVWWFSWAPFAGLFLASISRGRTLRTVAATGVFVAGLATLLWFAIVGNAAIYTQAEGITDILALGDSFTIEEVAGFALFGTLPMEELLVFGLFALIITWIVTSGDTSTLVISILGSEPGIAPGSATRAFWGVLQGAMGLGLIVVGGANSLQTAAVVTGGPIGLLIFVGVVGLFLEFYRHETGMESDTAEAPSD